MSSKHISDNQEQLGGQFEADGYEIDYHANPRPSHADMGGKQYAIGEAKTIDGIYYPCFEEAEPLMADYGCLHFKWPIILGVSEPNYSKQELSDLKAKDNEKFEFEGKKYTKYQASQVQRQLETAMRHQKDRANIAKAAGDDTLRRDAQGKIDMLASKYKRFSEAAGLPTKVERLRAAGFHRVKTQAQLQPMFTNSGNGGIIKSVKEADNSSKALLRIPQIPSSTITKKIESGEYSTKLSIQQYNKHIEGTAAYNAYKNTRFAKGGNPQSVLSVSQEEAQAIIIEKSGTGIIRCNKNGLPKPQESISYSKNIGYYYGKEKYWATSNIMESTVLI